MKITEIAAKLNTIAAVEKKRYQQKGIFNTVVALVLLFGIYLSLWYSFRIIWPESIDNKDAFVAWNSIVVHTLAQVAIIALTLPGYLGWSAYNEYQINKKWEWPWQKENWGKLVKKTALVLFINEVLIYPIPCYLSGVLGIKMRFEGFPSFWELFFQTQLLFFMEDFFFYWVHRVCHMYKTMYKIHKVHHEYEHEFVIGNEYTHPIDFILSSIMPSALAIMLMGSSIHCFTALFWVGYKIIFSSQSHCGYGFPWSPLRVLPLVAEVEYHDNHHSLNVGNYAAGCYSFDILFGTEGPYIQEFLQRT